MSPRAQRANCDYEDFFEMGGQLECPLTAEDCDIIIKVCGSLYWCDDDVDRRDYTIMKMAELIRTKPADKQAAIQIATAIAWRG